jgi:hypothetical protein
VTSPAAVANLGLADQRYNSALEFDISGVSPSIGPKDGTSETKIALRIAANWLIALRHHDLGKLQALSAFPFSTRNTATEAGCSDQTIDAADGIADALHCLMDDSLLAEQWQDLERQHHTLLAEPLRTESAPAWAARWLGEAGGHSTLVFVDVPGNGVAFHFIFTVYGDAVRSLWKDVEFDPT